MKERIITYEEWLYLAKKYMRQLITLITSFVFIIVCGAAIVSHTFSEIDDEVLIQEDEIETLIYERADEQGVKVYPYRVTKILKEIRASGHYTVKNIENIISANMDELKKMK